MTESEDKQGPSGALPADLDWNQIHETVRMLHLAVAQINMAMREGDESVDTLTNSFTYMIESVKTIAAAAQALAHPEEDQEIKEGIQQNCEQVESEMHSAVVAFQFYDKLSQRLVHVMHSLESLAELVGDKSRLFKPQEWEGLQDKIRSRYSTPEEQDMFDALLAGATIQEALEICELRRSLRPDDDIELF